MVPQGRNSAESLVGIYHTTLLYSVLYATRTTYKKAAQAYAHAYAQAYAPRHFKYRYLMQIECKNFERNIITVGEACSCKFTVQMPTRKLECMYTQFTRFRDYEM